jgi:hypothetical protein
MSFLCCRTTSYTNRNTHSAIHIPEWLWTQVSSCAFPNCSVSSINVVFSVLGSRPFAVPTLSFNSVVHLVELNNFITYHFQLHWVRIRRVPAPNLFHFDTIASYIGTHFQRQQPPFWILRNIHHKITSVESRNCDVKAADRLPNVNQRRSRCMLNNKAWRKSAGISKQNGRKFMHYSFHGKRRANKIFNHWNIKENNRMKKTVAESPGKIWRIQRCCGENVRSYPCQQRWGMWTWRKTWLSCFLLSKFYWQNQAWESGINAREFKEKERRMWETRRWSCSTEKDTYKAVVSNSKTKLFPYHF